MLEPSLMNSMRKATLRSLLSPSTARYSTILTQDAAAPVRFSRGLVNLQSSRSNFYATPAPRYLRLQGVFSTLNQQNITLEKYIYNPCVDGIFQYGIESNIAIIDFLNAVRT